VIKVERRLILAYPGTGARTLCEGAQKTFFLDAIGYRSDGGYFEWNIDLNRFGRIWNSDKSVWNLYVGWGQNWKSLIDIVGLKRTHIYVVTPIQYYRRVELFRKTEQYRSVDLPAIKEAGFEEDHPIEWYVGQYKIFLNQFYAYMSKCFVDSEFRTLENLYIASLEDIEWGDSR
jgi:hypothetical protein